MDAKKTKVQCANCLSGNASGAKFCQNCGAALGRACPSCGNRYAPEAKFCDQCGTRLSDGDPLASQESLSSLQQSTPQALREKIITAKARLEGERKPVAILFTDIVDSTSIAERMDPEDWREIITGAHRLVSQIVYRYEGTIAQLLGDGVLAFFGAPITHEDDPMRAVRAGLEIQEAIRQYQQTIKRIVPNFQMRVGINTGLVVVGNIGDDLHMEYQAIGDAVNLAARLQSLASPGKVLISENTYLAQSRFVECTDLGRVMVKGKSEPVHIYQVDQLKDEPFYLPPAGRTAVPMVGREDELSRLRDLAAAVGAGIGRAAIVLGEPGVGKSRLVSEWKTTLEGSETAAGWIEGHCLSYGRSVAYHLVSDLLRSMAGLNLASSQAETRLALQSFIQKTVGDNWLETYAPLGHMLSIPLEEEALVHIRGLDPRTLQGHYFTALQKVLLALAARRPLVFLCEDLHWADPSSVELLARLLTLTREAPILFCFTTRPDQDTPGWQLIINARETLGAGLTEIALGPLSSDATQQMISTLFAAGDLPAVVEQLVLQKAEGNPLFVEEVMHMLLEQDALIRENDTWIVRQDLALLEIPDTLKRLILSRIDRLAEEPKRVLRVASVIGREFAVKVLEQVYADPSQADRHGKIAAHLSTLEYANLVKLAAVHPDLRYLFYHALVQEAAYEAMLKADRKVLHRMVAETLESLFPDRLDDLAATLGYHFGKGEIHEKAVAYLAQAADHARAKYANQEAIGLYYMAIELIEREHGTSSKGDTWAEEVVHLREGLGDVLHLVGRHHDARAAFQTALEHIKEQDIIGLARLQRKIGNTWIPVHKWDKATQSYQATEKILGPQQEEEKTPAWWQEWLQLQMEWVMLYYWQNHTDEIKKIAVSVRPIVEKYGSPAQRGGFYRGMVMANLRSERYRVTDELLADMHAYLSIQKEANHPSELAFAYFMQGFVYLWHRDLEPAETAMQTALSMARQIGDITIEARILTYLTVCFRMRGLVEEVRYLTVQSVETATRAGMPEYQATAQANLAWALWQAGDLVEARKKALEALDQWQKLPAGHASYSFIWTAMFPLMAVAMQEQQLEQAAGYARAMLDPAQMRLPDPLEESLNQAILCWEDRISEDTLVHLQRSIDLAKEYGYL